MAHDKHKKVHQNHNRKCILEKRFKNCLNSVENYQKLKKKVQFHLNQEIPNIISDNFRQFSSKTSQLLH